MKQQTISESAIRKIIKQEIARALVINARNVMLEAAGGRAGLATIIRESVSDKRRVSKLLSELQLPSSKDPATRGTEQPVPQLPKGDAPRALNPKVVTAFTETLKMLDKAASGDSVKFSELKQQFQILLSTLRDFRDDPAYSRFHAAAVQANDMVQRLVRVFGQPMPSATRADPVTGKDVQVGTAERGQQRARAIGAVKDALMAGAKKG